MELFGIGQHPAMRNGYAPQREDAAAPSEDKKTAPAGKDTVALSGSADYLQGLQKQFPKHIERVREKNREAAGKLEELLAKAEESGELALGDEDMRWLVSAAKALEAAQARGSEEADEEENGDGDQSGTNGCVGINAAKLARMLAAAKTRAQVQAVIAKIQADLDECDAGKAQGMDVDEASVEAAESLLQEAKSRLSGAENREATPEEEMASALASLM